MFNFRYRDDVRSLINPFNEKYKNMSKIKENIKYYILSGIDSWEDGLRKEFDFAVKTNAKYWSPAPGPQVKWFKEYKMNRKED